MAAIEANIGGMSGEECGESRICTIRYIRNTTVMLTKRCRKHWPLGNALSRLGVYVTSGATCIRSAPRMADGWGNPCCKVQAPNSEMFPERQDKIHVWILQYFIQPLTYLDVVNYSDLPPNLCTQWQVTKHVFGSLSLLGSKRLRKVSRTPRQADEFILIWPTPLKWLSLFLTTCLNQFDAK